MRDGKELIGVVALGSRFEINSRREEKKIFVKGQFASLVLVFVGLGDVKVSGISRGQ